MTADHQAISVLVVEDRDDHAARIEAACAGLRLPARVHRETSLERGWAAIEAGGYDVVLLGLGPSEESQAAAFDLCGRVPAPIPVVAVADDEGPPDVGLAAVRAGAHECLHHPTLTPGQLDHAIRYGLTRSRFRVVLRETERRVTEMIASAMDGIITTDEQYRIVVFNPAAERIFGVAAADAIGSTIDRFIPEPERGRHRAAMTRFGAGATPLPDLSHQRRVTGLRANGEVFPIEASISYHTVDGRQHYTAIVRDVTSRVRADEALRRSEAHLQAALDAGKMGTWTYDFQTNSLWLDDRTLLLVGRTRATIPNDPDGVTAIVHPEDREQAWQGLSFDRGDPADPIRSAELRALLPDGGSRWLSMVGRLACDAHGTPTGVVGTAIDISARKDADLTRLRSEKLEALGTLAGGIAHDFNNILLAIMGNAGLAELELAGGHPARENVSEIAKAATRAAELVRRITAFSRPQDEQQRVMPLGPVVEEAVSLLRGSVPARARLALAAAADLPLVLADATEIHQVVVNLVTNAVYALGDGQGHVRVGLDEVSLSAAEAAVLSGLVAGPHLRLTVSDDGSGIDMATLSRIFDPYFTTKPPGQGTGLGLALVHAIVVAHRGAVTVTSVPGQGSTFTIYLPVATGIEDDVTAPSDGVPRGRGEHVLFVDDEPALVRLADRLLLQLGYRVTSCQDPAFALELFRSRPSDFDLVVTDLAMPVVNGLDVARTVRQLRPEIPVVVTSGYIAADEREIAFASGVRDILLKPTTREAFGRVLHAILHAAD